MLDVIQPLVDILAGIDLISQWSEEIAKILVSVLITLVGLFFTRYVLVKLAWRVVRRTEAEWDNNIILPIANRMYVFVLVAGLEISMRWTLGANNEIYSAISGYLNATYIILSVSLISVAIKNIVPAAMERYNTNKSVTVTGGNPLVVISARSTVWFIGVYLI